MSLMLGKNISSTCKIRYVRYIVLSCKGSLRGADGMTHHVHARPPINLRLTGRAAHMPIQFPLAGQGHVSTLDHRLSVIERCMKSTLTGPQRRANHSTTLEYLSSSATEAISGPKLVSTKQRTRAERSCRSRDTTFGHMSGHEDTHGGWRRTG